MNVTVSLRGLSSTIAAGAIARLAERARAEAAPVPAVPASSDDRPTAFILPSPLTAPSR
jgi:hypothetical protein